MTHGPGVPATPLVLEAFRGGRRLILGALAAAAAGAILFAVGLALDPRQAFFSYLAAFAYVLSLALGALIFLQIGHVTGARWFVVVRRLTEGVVATLPLLALLFVPLVFGLRRLYPWVAPPATESHHTLEILHHKAAYLNVPFFLVRAGVYFGLWIVLALLLRHWSLRQDRSRDPELSARQRTLSAATLPAMAITLTFAAFDWLMSLAPTWFSAAFGVYYFAGGFVAAIGLVIVLAWRVERAGAIPPVVNASVYHALGRLLFAFVVFWAYIAFAQLFLIWIADKPEEVTWYIARTRGSWGAIGLLLIVGHFALPFFILLSRDLKRRPAALSAVAAWILIMHYVDLHWLVLPELHAGFRPHWLDLAALLAVGGLATAFAVWRLRGHALIATSDPQLAASLRYSS